MEPGTYAGLVRSEQSGLLLLGWALTRDSHLAHDLTQETFVRGYVKRRRVARADSPQAYLRTIMLNLWRGQRQRHEHPTDSPAGRPDGGLAMPTLRELAPDLDPIDSTEVLTAGRKRQRRHRLFGAGAVAVVAVAAVTVATQILPRTQQAVPAVTASTPAVVCPTPSPRPGEPAVAASYPPLVVWKNKHYLYTENPGSPAQQIGRVPCNIVDIQDAAQKLWDGPWPDGSSTVAKVGTPIHAQQGGDPTCELTLLVETEWLLFRAEDC